MTPGLLAEFLSDTGIAVDPTVSLNDWGLIGVAFGKYAVRRRAKGDGQPKRPLADFVIGAHAFVSCDRLLTLDGARHKTAFPKLALLGV